MFVCKVFKLSKAPAQTGEFRVAQVCEEFADLSR